ncbi:hypothetical protein ACA910_010221 [Epithemia clementina (nom. ined.)]
MKSRFDGLDVFAMVCHLRRTLLGSKVVNIYDGVDGDNNNNTTYAFKLDSPLANTKKTFLILQSGIRFHDVDASSSSSDEGGGGGGASLVQSYANTQPSPFCSKLRKHLRHSRLEQIQQIGQLDRVVMFTFFGASTNTASGNSSGPPSSSSSSCSLILELYSKGNLILTDSKYEILALLRSHVYQTTPSLTDADAASTNDKNKKIKGNASKNATAKGKDNDKKSINDQSDVTGDLPQKANNNSKEDQVAVKVGKIYPVTYATTSKTAGHSQNISSNNYEPNNAKVEDDQSCGILSEQFWSWIQQQLQQELTKVMEADKSKKQQPKHNTNNKQALANHKQQGKEGEAGSIISSNFTLKTLLLRNSSGVSHYGPALLEHVILCAGTSLSPNQPLPLEDCNSGDIQATTPRTNTLGGLSLTDWEKLRQTLHTEAPAVLARLQAATEHETPGYLLYKDYSPMSTDGDDNNIPISSPIMELSSLPHPDKTLIEFQPHLLKQHETLQYIETRHFGQAVSDFFAQLQAQKLRQKARQAEQSVVARLQNVQLDQQQRVQALEAEIVVCHQRAMAVEQNATQVDQALQVVNSALDSGMDWDQLEQVVQVEQEEHANPIALLIKELQLEKEKMILTLPVLVDKDGEGEDEDDDEHDDNKNNDDGLMTIMLDVPIHLHETAHANASRLFAQYRDLKEKSRKTLEATTKVLESAQVTAERQLAAAQAKQQKRNIASSAVRKTTWFEKFHWMITRDNYLVLAGRDAHQNELLVKRYLRPGDAYLHADVHGAASCILRAKRQRPNNTTDSTDAATSVSGSTLANNNNSNNKSKPLPLSEQALVEAGQFTICHSSAWSSRMVTSAWWVESHQVSKTAPTGEYLTVGSFMIRGKKNYLPPVPLEMGLAVLFRLGDAESIARHKDKERRDFQLLAAEPMDDYGNAIVDPPNHKKDGVRNMDGNSQSNDVDDFDGQEIQGEAEIVLAEKGDNGLEVVTAEEEKEKLRDGGNSLMGNDPDSDNPAKADEDDPETNGRLAEQRPPIDEKSAEFSTISKRKKGLSVRDRKLIKKYGSLEEAERVHVQHLNTPGGSTSEKADTMSDISSTTDLTTTSTKRGKKSKLKKQKKKYGDQDEEDRELALLLLQGGAKYKGKKSKNATKNAGPKSKVEEEVGAATAALLSKDPRIVAESLPESVRETLMECLRRTDDGNHEDNEEFHWQHIDGNVVEQLVELQPEEAQLAAVTRLLSLKETTEMENLTMSLAGILRTIRKYGHKNLLSHKQQLEKTDSTRKGQSAKNKKGQDDDNDDDDEANELEEATFDEIDDTAELAKLTGKPLPEDVLLCAVPVCAPYSTLSQCQFRVKLTPGNGKRGKAAKQCVDFMLQQHQPNSSGNNNKLRNAAVPSPNDLYLDLIKRVSDNEWVQTIIPDVKIAAAGSSKLIKQQQKSNPGKKKK